VIRVDTTGCDEKVWKIVCSFVVVKWAEGIVSQRELKFKIKEIRTFPKNKQNTQKLKRITVIVREVRKVSW
jgi:hypothetical protein